MLGRLFGSIAKGTRISEAAATLADSIAANSIEWVSDRHELRHKTMKVAIWIANDDYGLYLTIDGTRWVPNGSERALIWGAAKTLLDARGHSAARQLASKL